MCTKSLVVGKCICRVIVNNAWAMGWRLPTSRLAAILKKWFFISSSFLMSSSVKSTDGFCLTLYGTSSVSIAIKLGWPYVNVPVLSNATWVTSASVVMVCPRVAKNPMLANRLVETVNAMGVANDKAQGQVATNTATVAQMAWLGSIKYHAKNTILAITSTRATNQRASLSAFKAICGFSLSERFTSLSITPIWLSLGNVVICITNGWLSFWLPPTMLSPKRLTIKSLSPVNKLSDTVALSDSKTPSLMILLPASMRTISPTFSDWAETICSLSPLLAGSTLSDW